MRKGEEAIKFKAPPPIFPFPKTVKKPREVNWVVVSFLSSYFLVWGGWGRHPLPPQVEVMSKIPSQRDAFPHYRPDPTRPPTVACKSGSSVGTRTRRVHIFARFWRRFARSVGCSSTKISASELSRKFIKGCVVGWDSEIFLSPIFFLLSSRVAPGNVCTL